MSDLVAKRRSHRPTIVAGRYATTSASQVVEYRDKCPRKWAYKKLFKIEEPSTPAQERGTKVHSAIEHYLATGEVLTSVAPVTDEEEALNVAEYVSVAAPFLPPGAYEVEREVLLDTYPGGPLWVGYIDVRYPGVRILDHKTTSDFRYCKTPAELEDDTQLNVYARWEYQQGVVAPDAPLEVAHLYLRTRGRKVANYVPALTHKAHVEDIWQRDLNTVREMAQVVEAFARGDIREPDDVTPNTDMCGAYGGCFFRHRCGIGDFSVKNFVAAGMLTKRAREGQLAAQGLATTETGILYVQLERSLDTPKKENTMNSFEERLQAKAKSQPVLPPKPPAPDKAPLPTNHTMPEPAPAGMSLDERLKRVSTDLLPADAPDREALPGPASEPEPPAKQRRTTKTPLVQAHEAAGVDPAKFGLAQEPSPVDLMLQRIDAIDNIADLKMLYAEIQQFPVPDREGGLRDYWKARLAQLEAKRTPPQVEDEHERPTQPTSPPTVPLPYNAFGGTGHVGDVAARCGTLATPHKPNFTLYIDCFPVKGPHRSSFVLAEEWLMPIMAQVADDNGVPDYRLIQFTAKALLAQAIRREVHKVPEALVVSSYSAGSGEMLESLIPWATAVVRGK